MEGWCVAGVQSVERSFTILASLAAGGGVGVSELARVVGLPSSTVQRLLAALVAVGAVVQHPDRTYDVSLKLFEWGQAPVRRLRLREVAKPFMQELAVEVGETIALGVLDGGHVMHIEWIPARHRVQPRIAVGERRPAHASSLGRCLLAWLPDGERKERLEDSVWAEASGTDPGAMEGVLAQVRADRYSVVVHAAQNVVTVASPLWAEDQVVGAIGIGGPSTRFDTQQAEIVTPRLFETCSAIGDQYTLLSHANQQRGTA